MDRYFEKISYEQFKKDIADDKELYDSYELPKRATKASVGYDFFAMKDYKIEPGEILKIPTGYKAKFGQDEALLLFVRSSMGFKYNVRMCNQVGLIESDYYNNDSNEGHMFVALQNEGDETYFINKGDAYTQAMFINFLICDDDNVQSKRQGGFGSTNKKEGRENE